MSGLEATIREALSYNPSTGELLWKKKITKMIEVGTQAGHFNQKGYRIVSICGKLIRASHIAWFITYGRWPKLLDHKNRKRADDSIDNLREATYQQNSANSITEGRELPKGVYRTSDKKAYFSAITADYKTKYLGRFKNPEDAAKAYSTAAVKNFGEYART